MKTMDELYADSTIAMSAYNVLAPGGGCGINELLGTLQAIAHPGLGLDTLMRAVSGLLDRRLIRIDDDGEQPVYVVCDPRPRIVVGRDRSDLRVEDYRAVGGWNGWIVRDPGGAIALLQPPVTEDKVKP